MEAHKTLSMYIGHNEGGCSDIGHLQLRGFTLISDADLLALRTGTKGSELHKLLAQVKDALITPQGEFKTKKAERAYYAIVHFMGEA